MKKNKLVKILFRYTKEKGKYQKLKNTLKILPINKIRQLCTLKQINRHLIYTGIEKGNDTWSPFLMFVYEKNKKEIIKLFENFLEKEKIKISFYKNIDSKHIEHLLKPYGYKLKNETKNKKDLLYDNVAPKGFVQYAFNWDASKSPQKIKRENKFIFWMEKNRIWEKELSKYIQKKYET